MIVPSIKHDEGEGIRADSAFDGELFLGDQDLDNIG